MTIDKLLPGIQKNILLKNYTTFKIGGKAKYFYVAKTKENLIKAIKMAKELKLPFFVLGGGSNLLISDNGFKGLVIKIENLKLKIENSKLITDAGVSLSKLVDISTKRGLTDLEWATGIPGTVGGAVNGNAGAFGKSMKYIVKKVEVFDVKNKKIKFLKNKDCKFSYRDSVFKHKKNLIILSAALQLKKGNKNKITEKIKKYLEYKKNTQPLNYPSAGSIFKNPKGFSVGELGEEDKSSSSSFAAARMIEECGLKGKKIGNAKISEKHANFIVNLGSARAKDVEKLIKLMKQKVKNKFGVVLKEEIQFL